MKKILSIGTDRKIFEQSAVRQRMIKYGEMFEELHIVVFSTRIMNYESRIKISENVWVYPTNSRNRLFYIFDAFQVVRRIIRTSYLVPRDLAISTQDPFETGLVGILLKLIFGAPLQIQIHTDFYNKYYVKHSFLNVVRFILAHFVLPYADEVRVVSERVAKSVRQFNKNVFVLPISQNFKDVEREDNSFRGRFIAVSRLEPEKDIATALRAFAKVVESYSGATFTIVGDGGERQNLELLCKKLSIDKNVNFVGWQDDVGTFLKSSDVFVSTSLYEGYGISILEAAHYGLPMVLTNTGIAEVFGKGGALIADPKDINKISELMEKMWDSDTRLRLSVNAKLVANQMTIGEAEYIGTFSEKLNNLKTEPKSLTFRFFDFIKSVFSGNKIIRFIAAGGTAAFVQIFSLFVLTDVVGVWYLYSSILSFAIALVVSFTLQKFWAFQDKNINGMHTQFVKYSLIVICGLVINTILMYLFVDVIHLWYLVSQIFIGIIIAFFNFYMYKKFIFKS